MLGDPSLHLPISLKLLLTTEGLRPAACPQDPVIRRPYVCEQLDTVDKPRYVEAQSVKKNLRLIGSATLGMTWEQLRFKKQMVAIAITNVNVYTPACVSGFSLDARTVSISEIKKTEPENRFGCFVLERWKH